MSDKKLITGIVIGVAVTAVICYIIYLQTERSKLSNENDLLKQRQQDSADGKIISINSVPKPIRNDFEQTLQDSSVETLKETYKNSLARVKFLKTIIEDRDGYKIFYRKHKPITKETDLHILYDLTWYQTEFDINKEVNNGRGSVDFKISLGLDQTLVEFKLASNPHLKRNLEKQIDIYAKANNHPAKIITVICITEKQELRLKAILEELNMHEQENIVAIDARIDNKPSASVA